jgi:outer membrane biosynthesis protein TonB
VKPIFYQKLASLSLGIAVLFASAEATGQSAAIVSDMEARDHLLKHIDPIYPAIAKAAQVQGPVVLQLEIDQSGQVAKIKALSGPQCC